METAKKWFHFIGIAGVGMGGLAKILRVSGHQVSGSDLQENAITEDLRTLGATIYSQQRAENIRDGIDVVVISSAIPEQNPELQEARRKQIPILHRGELLAQLVNQYKGIAIAGSHGKTTTTAMVYEILHQTGLEPYFMVGGEICSSHLRAAAGKPPYFVTEADESDGSFLALKPFIALVTNVEDDHLDHYQTMENLVEAFNEFIENVQTGGFACLCSQNEILAQLASEVWTRTVTYGQNPTDDYQMVEYQPYGFGSRFAVWSALERDYLGEVILKVPGYHNAMNALGAFAVTAEMGCPIELITKALGNFSGTKRRFEVVGAYQDTVVVDDYAHHPTEIKATLQAARDVYEGRIVAVFQPHRYSRTQHLAKEFGDAFDNADVVIITDIYAAGEQPIPGVDSSLIVQAVQTRKPDVIFISDKKDILKWLDSNLQAGDMLLTLGAGDIWKIGRSWLDAHQE